VFISAQHFRYAGMVKEIAPPPVPTMDFLKGHALLGTIVGVRVNPALRHTVPFAVPLDAFGVYFFPIEPAE